MSGHPLFLLQFPDWIKNNGRNRKMRVVIQRPVGFSQHSKKSSPYSPAVKHPSAAKEAALSLPGTTEPPKQKEEKVHTQNIMISGISPTSPGSQPFPKTVKLPKVRVFVCGSEAEKCASFILKDSNIEIVCKNYGYATADFSMATDCCDNVVISKVCSNLFSASGLLPGSFQPCSAGIDSCKCKSCGNKFHSNGSQNKLRSVINVELHIVSDDKIFHNCCNYLFTKESVFLLTFDCAKLLQSKTELKRMLNLSHSIVSFSDECQITMCGLFDGLNESSNIKDEVRALFYGPYNTQLQQYNLEAPELFDMQSFAVNRTNHSDSHGLQTLLWKMASDTVQRQAIPHPFLAILDYLHTVKDKELAVLEDYFTSVIRSILPQYDMAVHYTILTHLDLFREIIRGSK